MSKERTCERCNGTGRMKKKDGLCWKCGGRGKIGGPKKTWRQNIEKLHLYKTKFAQ